MKKRRRSIILGVFCVFVLGVIVVVFSSITATDCVARVKGGAGTVEDPLLIEVEGNAGLTPILDSLLPFRAVPSICLSYTGERFYVPGLNDFFQGKQALARSIYVVAIILLIALCLCVGLRMAGKRIVIVDRNRT